MIEQSEPQKKDWLLPASIIVAGVMISGSIFYLVGSQNPAPRDARNQDNDQLAQIGVPLGGADAVAISSQDVILGSADAPVSFIEYGDYQCPFCGRFFSQTEPLIREEYVKTGKVKMAYRDFAFLGPESYAASEAAACARDQKQFWAYHDLLYQSEVQDGQENNGNLNRALFMNLAGQLDLDAQMFGECLDSKKHADAVQKEAADARAVGVNSTPTSYINGQQVQGALPYESFKVIIDNFLDAS